MNTADSRARQANDRADKAEAALANLERRVRELAEGWQRTGCDLIERGISRSNHLISLLTPAPEEPTQGGPAYTLTCDKCGRSFDSVSAFLRRQFCPQCKKSPRERVKLHYDAYREEHVARMAGEIVYAEPEPRTLRDCPHSGLTGQGGVSGKHIDGV